jgi:hypothetical protein
VGPYNGGDIMETIFSHFEIKKYRAHEEIPIKAKFLYAREEEIVVHKEDHLRSMNPKEVVFYYQEPIYVIFVPKGSELSPGTHKVDAVRRGEI